MALKELDPATIDLSSPNTFAGHPEQSPNHGFWVVTKHEDLVQIHRGFRQKMPVRMESAA